MNKDDILAKSRAENQGSDEFEKQVLEKAGKLSSQVGLMVCCFIALFSVIRTGRVNNGCWVIYFSISATLFWTKYIHLRKRHELMMAVISTLVGLLFLGLFVLEMWRWPHG
ncbi:MAG: hypothetical protein HDT15_12560 [Oscillibacter sp.]|nr:hypothetical protein [Oscillibacter sp.]